MNATVIGLDIGGANLKAARPDGTARTVPFELWKQPAELPDALRDLLHDWPADKLAVTMTGELCDCFETKRAGVNAILDAVHTAFPKSNIAIWRTAGRFVSLEEAREEPQAVAAANWHALATFAGRFAPHGHAMLLDIGSTTSDLVPLSDGKPDATGLTDPERLRTGELVYTGVRRTPICALLHRHVAAEVFATTYDVYLLLDHLHEAANDRMTADGRPAMRPYAHARLARMLGGDALLTLPEETLELAHRVHRRQLDLLSESASNIYSVREIQPKTVILSGAGEFLAREVVEATGWKPTIISLAERIGPAASLSACAYALAILLQESKG